MCAALSLSHSEGLWISILYRDAGPKIPPRFSCSKTCHRHRRLPVSTVALTVFGIHRRFESSKSFLQTRLFRIATIATFAALPLLALQKPLYSAADARPDAIFSTDVSAPSNDFGFRLLRNLADGRSTNVIVSPLSMSLALAMLNNGADGATKTAIAKTLGTSSLTESAFNQNNSVLIKIIEQADPQFRWKSLMPCGFNQAYR